MVGAVAPRALAGQGWRLREAGVGGCSPALELGGKEGARRGVRPPPGDPAGERETDETLFTPGAFGASGETEGTRVKRPPTEAGVGDDIALPPLQPPQWKARLPPRARQCLSFTCPEAPLATAPTLAPANHRAATLLATHAAHPRVQNEPDRSGVSSTRSCLSPGSSASSNCQFESLNDRLRAFYDQGFKSRLSSKLTVDFRKSATLKIEIVSVSRNRVFPL